MRKNVALLFFILLGIAVQAVEIGGEIKNTVKIYSNGKIGSEADAKIELKMKGDGFYSQITVKGDYTTQGSVEIDRAYTEIYKDKFTAAIGRQRISWGTGYLFNYADAFNEPDPKDPKGDKKGVDSLKLRYDIRDTSRVEVVAVQNTREKADYAVRAASTIGKFEVMADYIKVTPAKLNAMVAMFPGGEISNEYVILETRGEYEIGVWGALVYKKNNTKNLPQTIKSKIEENEKIGVIGADYTFSIGVEGGSSLYILGEYSHNETTQSKLAYGQAKYTVFKDLDILAGLLADTARGGVISITSINYVVNDYITATVGFDRYINTEKSSYLSMNGSRAGSEIYFTLKSNF